MDKFQCCTSLCQQDYYSSTGSSTPRNEFKWLGKHSTCTIVVLPIGHDRVSGMHILDFPTRWYQYRNSQGVIMCGVARILPFVDLVPEYYSTVRYLAVQNKPSTILQYGSDNSRITFGFFGCLLRYHLCNYFVCHVVNCTQFIKHYTTGNCKEARAPLGAPAVCTNS